MHWRFWRPGGKASRTKRVERLLAGLSSKDEDRWTAGDDAMHEVAGSLTEGEVLALLDAVATIEPLDDDHDARAVILLALELNAKGRASYVPALERVIPKLRGDSLEYAMGMLARAPNGLDALIRLAPAHGQLERATLTMSEPEWTMTLEERQRVLALANHAVCVDDIAALALAWLGQDRLSHGELDLLADGFLTGYRAARRRLAEEGELVESTVGMYLDLFHALPKRAVEHELATAARELQPSMAVFAVTSLLRSGAAVDDATIERVAANDGTRSALYELLATDGLQHQVPPQWRTQLALARADLARWCAFPTELNKVPDELELMKLIPIDAGDDVLELYVFRFRTFEPHWAAKEGWLAGVAGPYPRKDGPHVHASGTFSAFKAADSATPEEHAGEIESILGEWFRDQGLE